MGNHESEYVLFMSSSHSLSQGSCITEVVREEMNPSTGASLILFLLASLFGGGATLLVCPQFGWGGLLFGHELLHWLFSVGDVACAIFCSGIFFIAANTCSYLVMPEHYLAKLNNQSLLVGIVVPMTLSIGLMGGAVLAGEFVFMGSLFIVTWFIFSFIIQIVASHAWRRYASH